jgi:hypothetical protein
MDYADIYPNLIILGAPKCGTTAIHRYLSTHPQVFMHPRKEINYFADDFINLRYYCNLPGLEDYLRLFPVTSSTYKFMGESSPIYLYSQVAAANIYKFNPTAKLIVLIRNPVDFVVAFHHQMVLNLFETENDIRKAWMLRNDRMKGLNLPKLKYIQNIDWQFYDYEGFAKFGHQLERLYQIFPQDQIHVILLEDLANDARNTYLGIIKYLGLEDDGRVSFKVEYYYHPKWIEKMYFYFENKGGGSSLRVFIAKIAELFSKPVPRKGIESGFREELVACFLQDINILSNLLKRDLSHWAI